jgi:hypothetical protein
VGKDGSRGDERVVGNHRAKLHRVVGEASLAGVSRLESVARNLEWEELWLC